ncbi:MAG: FAD-binding oxidoreductase [Nocardiopsaceae bacterium]|jgi:FAD/FMN-containing dehydrogenase|nr:FAD-binding oxidoreductase [Nocardiopsaceae bacterium]
MHAAANGIGNLRQSMQGPVITPGDPGFDDARREWNEQLDRRPAVIARCASTTDDATATIFAREQPLEISVRGGAHNTAGMAVGDDGLMIDLSSMNAVTVDPAAKRATVGGGALQADLDAATQGHSLAVPAGLISHTGVAGLTLGGGMGWLTRKFGLSIDNLRSAEVVTADGQIMQASPEDHPDLFWAIRGGGGNFGIVTNFDFQLNDVDPMVQFGLFFWPQDQAMGPLRLVRDVVDELPANVNAVIAALNAPASPFVPEEHHDEPGYALLLVGFGSAEEHAQLAGQIRQGAPPLFEIVTPMPYVELQKLFDEANAWGFYGYDMATYLEDLSDDVLGVFNERVPRKTSAKSSMLLYRLDGAYSQVGDDETAFGGGRSPRYGAFLNGIASDADTWAADRDWVRGFWDALRPHAIGSGEGYVNASADLKSDRVRNSYGPSKYERLSRIKAEYDPDNALHRNANIQPAKPAGAANAGGPG